MNRLATTVCGVNFENPVILASGTCGFGREMDELFDVDRLGGLSSKGLTLNPRSGNTGVRIWETPSGVMNSVGLENPGVRRVIERELPWMKQKRFVTLVNVGGHSFEDYFKAIELLNPCELDFIELNISCPNVKQGGMNFGIKTDNAREIVREVRALCRHRLLVKLSPNAESVVSLARMCEQEGADGVSLVNTFLAMAIDIRAKRPVFENGYAGLSGPAIKPIALRMVHEVAHAVNIPVIGLGGITTWQDAVEFIMAGAHAVQVGSASFINPAIALDIIDGMQRYMEDNGVKSLDEIRGIV